jgi:hypothetical protein
MCGLAEVIQQHHSLLVSPDSWVDTMIDVALGVHRGTCQWQCEVYEVHRAEYQCFNL